MPAERPWSVPVRLAEAARGPATRALSADEAARTRIARALGLEALARLQAELTLSPWLDGAELQGRWSADTTQLCSLSGEAFEQPLQGEFTVRVLPQDSPNAPAQEAEVAVDPEADDPPDIAEDDQLDLAGYVVEHLALEIDPFPRKPGAVFAPPEQAEPPSPFDVLKDFKPREPPG